MIYPVAVIVIAGARRRRHSVEGDSDVRGVVLRGSGPSCRCPTRIVIALSDNLGSVLSVPARRRRSRRLRRSSSIHATDKGRARRRRDDV